MSILTSGLALGGLPLISGQFVTPIAALFKGWSTGTVAPSALASSVIASNSSKDFQDTPRFAASLVGLDTLPTPRPVEDRVGRPQSSGFSPPAPAKVFGDDWLASVGAFLDSADARAA